MLTTETASFAGLFYTSLWLGGKFHVMDNRGETWKPLLIMVPILAATLVAVSRIMDARHHPFDVITGGLLGIACAVVSYHQYFPPISESWRKGRAYPIRTWGTQPPQPMGAQLTSCNESTAALRNPEADRLSPSDARGRSASPSNLPVPEASGYGTNPFASQAYPRRPHDHNPEGNWSSSEEDVADGYEMQHGYAMAANPAVRAYPPPYGADTAYSSQAPAVPAGSGIHSPSGAMMSQPDRGRPLTDLPGREV